MQYWIGFVVAVTLLPVSAGAQDTKSGEQAAKPEAPASALEQPVCFHFGQALLCGSGQPGDERTLSLSRAELRQKRSKIAIGLSALTFAAGTTMALVGAFHADMGFGEQPSWVAPVGWAGVAMMGAGSVGMLVGGGVLAASRRTRDRLKYGRRVQWDVARSRLEF